MSTSYAPTSVTHSPVKRTNGIAGQFQLSTVVTYTWEDGTTSVTPLGFVGNVAGGPIVMVMGDGHQTFVSASTRDKIGHTLTPEWVARFMMFTPDN